ncbi:MAG: carboxypeptidase-like regulatory domain-containing protein [Acidobacteriota bacterium]|nr:carboxypeptidase-like regulatory domain-containing protein [Acidobacteriota bacterium]MDQ7088134.1 carboxypeptidase-like regulatory domain-containing protein [Acidobacteriota bacterium]
MKSLRPFRSPAAAVLAIGLLLLPAIGPTAAEEGAAGDRPGTTAPAGKARLSGVLLDEQGQPVGGARVRLSPMLGETLLETTTDASGTFRFENLGHGYYRVAFEVGGRGYPSNRILLIPPEEKIEVTFDLGGFLPEDRSLGLGPDRPAPLLDKTSAGVAHLREKIGPSGWAWFRTGRGVAVLIGGGTLFVAGLIALSDSSENVVSPSSF